MNTEEIERQIKELLERQCGQLKKEILPETQVLRDLRLDGETASDFIEEFEKELHVDMTGFVFLEYFTCSTSAWFIIPPMILGALLAASTDWRPAKYLAIIIFIVMITGYSITNSIKKRRLKPLCISQLIDAAREGRWSPNNAIVPNLFRGARKRSAHG